MGGPEVEAFPSWMANERNVAVSTHRQALSALLFLYQKVLGVSLPWMDAIGRLVTSAVLGQIGDSEPEIGPSRLQAPGPRRLDSCTRSGEGKRCIEVQPLLTSTLPRIWDKPWGL